MTIYLRWWIQTAAATALAAACTADSAAPGGAAPVAGAWQFTGQESSGAGRTFSGVLALVSESSTTFSGTSDVVQTAAGQPPLRRSGPVSGRVTGNSTVDFITTAGGTQRQHLGTLVVDTMAGSWLELAASGGIASSGSFRAVRTSR